MNFSFSKLGTLCLGWGFAVLLGVVVSLNPAFILLLAWSIILLVT